MKTLYGFLWLSIAPLCATLSTPETGSVSSTNASYDGTALVLTGHVILDHGLGKMTAEEASLQRQEETAKDFPFSIIQLSKQVLLSLKNSAEVRCDHADLDFSALKGLLHAKENERVLYSDSLKRKRSNESSPMNMLSRTLELTFLKQEHDSKKADYEIDTILAKNDVEITYDDAFILNADHALYRRQLPSDNKTASKEFQGILSAFPKDDQSQCRLIHGNDLIDADSIDLDIPHSRLSMLHPQGTLSSSLIPNANEGNLRFRCEHLLWDNVKHALTLRGDVQIEDPSFGTVTANEMIELNHKMQSGKRILQSIHSEGPTSLIYSDLEHGGKHKLLSQGRIYLDRDKLLATLESPEVNGKVETSEQLYYEEEEISFYADQAALEYSCQDEILQPVSLTLKGNIRLFSTEPDALTRCGVADRMNYSLATRTLILSANPGKKVLFIDEGQGMKISAREVHITQDPETKQQTVKGVGNVQFALNAEENAMLQHLFPALKVVHE
jgi:lipopolysaccharide export system protein LptA